MDPTVVYIDQPKKSVQVELPAAWFPRVTWHSIDLSEQRGLRCLLGVIVENGDSFIDQFEEYVSADHTKHFILSLWKEFEDTLVIILDRAPDFQTYAVMTLPSIHRS